jgi:chromosome segregation ATPase
MERKALRSVLAQLSLRTGEVYQLPDGSYQVPLRVVQAIAKARELLRSGRYVSYSDAAYAVLSGLEGRERSSLDRERIYSRLQEVERALRNIDSEVSNLYASLSSLKNSVSELLSSVKGLMEKELSLSPEGPGT